MRVSLARLGRPLLAFAAFVAVLVPATGAQAAATPPGSLTQSWGNASGSFNHGGLDWVDTSTHINDTKSDGKCVYVEYRIDMAYSLDPDGVLGRVCGGGLSRDFSRRVGIKWMGAVRGVESRRPEGRARRRAA